MLPSQKQLKWSQLKVGLTVFFAAIVLGTLIILMSGTGGIFTSKITVVSYFPDASGLTNGAPVRLSGVDIGNVKDIRIVPDHPPLRPVKVTMKVNTRYRFYLRKDSWTLLSTAGVLGATYINIDSFAAKGAEVDDGDILQSKEQPGYDEVIRSANGSLQNIDVLTRRVDRILAYVESGQGSIGKLIYDPTLYNRVNATVAEFQSLVNDISQANGSLGKLIEDDELYNKANASIDQINKLIDDINAGNGTVGKLLKDPSLYNSANQTVANIKQLTDDINAGKGAIGKLAKDQQFANKLQDTMDRLSNLADKLDQGNGSLALAFRDPSLFNNANKLLTDSQELIKAIRENPKKYLTVHVKVF